MLSETAQNQAIGQKLMYSLHYSFPLDSSDCTDDTEAKSPGMPGTGSLVAQVLNALVAGCREACATAVNALPLHSFGICLVPNKPGMSVEHKLFPA